MLGNTVTMELMWGRTTCWDNDRHVSGVFELPGRSFAQHLSTQNLNSILNSQAENQVDIRVG